MNTFAYFNLHKKVFSLRNTKTRKVFAHAKSLLLTNAIFKVSEAGRQRVLTEQRKNVHAGVQGTLLASDIEDWLYKPKECREATYNPYKYSTFVDKLTGKPIIAAQYVLLSNKRIFYWS